jgi:hypothetical protein
MIPNVIAAGYTSLNVYSIAAESREVPHIKAAQIARDTRVII